MIKVDCSHIESEIRGFAEELAKYLAERMEIETEVSGTTVTIKDDVSKKKVKGYIKRFLHKNDAYDFYRVLATKEGYMIYKRPGAE